MENVAFCLLEAEKSPICWTGPGGIRELGHEATTAAGKQEELNRGRRCHSDLRTPLECQENMVNARINGELWDDNSINLIYNWDSNMNFNQ